MQVPRRRTCLFLRQFGVHRLAFGIWVEWGTAIVAVFERQSVVENNHFADADFLQHCFDLAG